MKAHNNNTVFILGAGFSADAGLPLIDNFMRRLRDAAPWLEEQGRDAEAEAIARVLDFRLKASAAASVVDLDLESVEELFSLASASPGSGLASDMPLAISATLDFCRATSPISHATLAFSTLAEKPGSATWQKEESSAFKMYGFEEYYKVPFYDLYSSILSGMLLDQGPDASSSVITFNYDTLVEESLASIGVCCDYGLGACIGDDNRSLQASGSAVLPVLKMHGSVNWAVDSSRAGRLTLFDNYQALRNELPACAPVLVPPTWNKTVGGHLNSVWERAVAALEKATRIVVLGFSIPPTDAHFKYLLAAGLRDNISIRKVVFVNPDMAPIKARAEKMFPSVHFRKRAIEYYDMKTSQFFSNIAFLEGIGLHIKSSCKIGPVN